MRHIVAAISNHERFTLEELETYVNASNYEYNFSLDLLIASNAIRVSNDDIIINIQEIDLIEIFRDIILSSCQNNSVLRKSILQIGMNRSGNYLRKPNIDQLLRKSNLFELSDRNVSFWWFQVKEIDRESPVSVANENSLTGYLGEFLTMEFEKKRLGSSDQIEWVSLTPNGDRFGYDIESVREEMEQKMLIEVKSSQNNFVNARMFLTYNEYKIMNKNISDYVFYLWWEVNDNTGCGPMIIEGSILAEKLTSLIENEIGFTDSLVIPFSIMGDEI